MSSPSPSPSEEEAPKLSKTQKRRLKEKQKRRAARLAMGLPEDPELPADYGATKLRKQQERESFGHNIDMNGRQMLKRGKECLASMNFIFVSVDCEMWEGDSKTLTEIGISVLDMQSSTAPWMPDIKSFHLLPLEAKLLVNGERVPDKRHLFAFGQSYEMPLAECLDFWTGLLDKLDAKAQKNGQTLYIVGHDVWSDLFLLAKSGSAHDRTIPVLDTYKIWRATCSSLPALGLILTELQMQAQLLHNAGNDAYHTMRLVLALCDENIRYKFDLDKGPSAEQAEREAAAMLMNDDDPDALPIALDPKAQELKDELDRIAALPAEEQAVARAERKQKKIEARLNEMSADMPGRYEKTTSAELQEVALGLLR